MAYAPRKIGIKEKEVSLELVRMDSLTVIKEAIKYMMTPQRLAMLLGLTEAELKRKVMEDEPTLNEIRELIYRRQIEVARIALNDSLDKKNVTDFMTGVADAHFEAWARFVATDFNIAGDKLLLQHAVQGRIGGNKEFWLSAPKETKESFREILTNIENFIQVAFHYIEGTDFVMRPYHRAMFDELKLVEKKYTDVLIINMPPRCGKTTTMLYWALQMLMLHPNANILYSSYGEVVLTLIRKKIESGFAQTKMLKSGDMMVNPFYEIFGVTKKEGFAKESDFYTTINSSFFSATLLGAVTGRGASIYGNTVGALVCDDIDNPNNIDTVRMETVKEKFEGTWKSRKGNNPIVLGMQRLADNDMTAHLISTHAESGLNVRVLTLPLEMTEEVCEWVAKQQAKYPKVHFIDPLKYAKIGESLLDKATVDGIKTSLHPSVYKTQYLQIPTNFDGSLFKSAMFYNEVNAITPVLNANNYPLGYVMVGGAQKHLNPDGTFVTTPVNFEGLFILHIDTTSGNTSVTGVDVDDCVWTLMVGGLKGRKAGDNYMGAILHQHALNSRNASDVVMQQTTLDILEDVKRIFNRDIDSEQEYDPKILCVLETHAQGGGLASYLRGLNLKNVIIQSYSRQMHGNKKQRFLQSSAFYEDRLLWWQQDVNLIQIKNQNGEIIKHNDWFYASRMQHLTTDGENKRLHDDYIEAPTDLCNLWIAEDKKDIFYQHYMKSIKI